MRFWTGTPPLGWEWSGEEVGPAAPTPEQRAKSVGTTNWAPRLKELGRSLYHGTSADAVYEIKKSGVLEPRAEWGHGFTGIFVWSDLESALNWANFWFGHDDPDSWEAEIEGGGAVIEIRPSALEVVHADWDLGNRDWQSWLGRPPSFLDLGKPKRKINWSVSQAFVIAHPIPTSELALFIEGPDFDKLVTEWEEAVEEWGISLRYPIPQFVEFIGEEGPGWARYEG